MRALKMKVFYMKETVVSPIILIMLLFMRIVFQTKLVLPLKHILFQPEGSIHVYDAALIV